MKKDVMAESQDWFADLPKASWIHPDKQEQHGSTASYLETNVSILHFLQV